MDESGILEERRDNRPRSNTWPLPDPSEFTKSEREAVDQGFKQLSEGPKKSSRKNAWGNLSYADLITQAIQSSAEQRLTLSQIYEWMVNTVPYFRDKGDSNSSAGWKNSIRHNLSLHSKFVRVQNEGNGKSSWWMINPDAKGGKTSRRRSGSLDSAPKSERKRGRSKKEKHKGEGVEVDCPSSPHLSVNRTRDGNRANSPGNVSPANSSSSDSLLTIPESESPSQFPLSESFGRPRTSSNASTVSSIGGRLSPIPSHADELELSEDQVPANFNMVSTPNAAADELSQLADSMSLDSYAPENSRLKQPLTPVSSILPSDPPHNDIGLTVKNSMGSSLSNSFETGYDSGVYLTPVQHRQQSLSPEMLPPPSINSPQPVYSNLRVLPQTPQPSQFQRNYHDPQELPSGHNNSTAQLSNIYCRDQDMEVQQTPVGMFPNFQSSFATTSAYVNGLPQNQSCVFTDPYLQPMGATPVMMANGVLSLQGHPFSRDIRMANNNQLEAMNEKFPSDLELDAFNGDLDCDIDSIIHDELIMGDGGLDFNFEQFISQIPSTPLTVGGLRGGLY